MAEDIIRVLQVIEYVGLRGQIEKHFKNKFIIIGERRAQDAIVLLKANIIGNFPEILESDESTKKAESDA